MSDTIRSSAVEEPSVTEQAEGIDQIASDGDAASRGLSLDGPGEPLPLLNSIPTQLIEAFLAVPAEEYVDVRVTRGDLDRLYGAINHGIEAQWVFQNAMIEQTNGRVDEANKKMREAQKRLILSANDLRSFMTALMASVLGPRSER